MNNVSTYQELSRLARDSILSVRLVIFLPLEDRDQVVEVLATLILIISRLLDRMICLCKYIVQNYG
jgi:hypothetical protein